MSESKTTACSGVVNGNSCKHGHHFSVACLGTVYPYASPVPSCCREDLVFDAARKAVTIIPWQGQS
jgi:hypothetical protein